MAPPELELLKTSILADKWTQPIVVLPDMTIVDGFHRWTASADPRIRAMTGGLVPVVVIEAVLRMAEIVRSMRDAGMPPEAICAAMGMEDEELERLLDRAGMPVRGTAGVSGFGRAWVPDRGST